MMVIRFAFLDLSSAGMSYLRISAHEPCLPLGFALDSIATCWPTNGMLFSLLPQIFGSS